MRALWRIGASVYVSVDQSVKTAFQNFVKTENKWRPSKKSECIVAGSRQNVTEVTRFSYLRDKPKNSRFAPHRERKETKRLFVYLPQGDKNATLSCKCTKRARARFSRKAFSPPLSQTPDDGFSRVSFVWIVFREKKLQTQLSCAPEQVRVWFKKTNC